MKYEKFLRLPPPPSPLPSPRYQHHFKALQEMHPALGPLDDTADECILIRSQIYQRVRAAEKHTTASELIHDLDLVSLGAVRLARSLRTRYSLHYRRLEDPHDRIQLEKPVKKDTRWPVKSVPIRSSEKTDGHIFINNPLVLSDLARGRIKPLLFPETELFPGRGRPSIDLYAVLEGILHKFLADLSWADLPAHYPSPGTCNRYYLAWKRDGTLLSIMAVLITLEIDMQYENEKRSEKIVAAFFKHPPVEDSP